LYSYVPTCKTKWNYQFNFSKTGVLIRPFAGLDYRVYMSNKAKPDFVLHDLYHSGTANTKSLTKLDYCTNLLEFANYCKNNNIDLYLSNIKQKDVNYDSTNQLLQHHITPLYDSLTNVALAKLTIAYNFLNKTQRKQFLEENVAGEILTGLESEQELTV
jgi:L-asparaginase